MTKYENSNFYKKRNAQISSDSFTSMGQTFPILNTVPMDGVAAQHDILCKGGG